MCMHTYMQHMHIPTYMCTLSHTYSHKPLQPPLLLAPCSPSDFSSITWQKRPQNTSRGGKVKRDISKDIWDPLFSIVVLATEEGQSHFFIWERTSHRAQCWVVSQLQPMYLDLVKEENLDVAKDETWRVECGKKPRWLLTMWPCWNFGTNFFPLGINKRWEVKDVGYSKCGYRP